MTVKDEGIRCRQLLLAAGIQLCVSLAWSAEASDAPEAPRPVVTASSNAAGSAPAGAFDGTRFVTDAGSVWTGAPAAESWWWQVRFAAPRRVGAILQVVGDHPRNFRNAPRDYVWRYSRDGRSWKTLEVTATQGERRLFRIHRLPRAVEARALRMSIDRCQGDSPTLREIELYPEPTSRIEFPDWALSVSSRESRQLSTEPCQFTRLIRQCHGWEKLPVQYIWHGDVDEQFVSVEPRPLCALLSGSLLEWCQRSREPWRGIQQVLAHRNLPIWGACGGAQILAILEETGVDQPWDCPRCRDPQRPQLPVYSHIGHTGDASCGDYSKCIGERGKFNMRIVARDPVLDGLPEVFEIMESHIGHIAYVPDGWVRIVTRGPGAHTVNQCLRVRDRYIYAAQFHIELPGTPRNSRRIMSNFLSLAQEWGGYNPDGAAVAGPERLRVTESTTGEDKK